MAAEKAQVPHVLVSDHSVKSVRDHKTRRSVPAARRQRSKLEEHSPQSVGLDRSDDDSGAGELLQSPTSRDIDEELQKAKKKLRHNRAKAERRSQTHLGHYPIAHEASESLILPPIA